MKTYDVFIIGGGAAGMVAAGRACSAGCRVAVADMGDSVARKVRVSGGGRCNFTNTAASRDRYFGENPDFVRGAIARVSPSDILAWANSHGIQPVQKAPGQYFSASGAVDVVRALEHDAAGADMFTNCAVNDVTRYVDGFKIKTSRGDFYARAIIIATGGMSYPQLGVSDIGTRIAKKFGHRIVPVRPALCAIQTDAFAGVPAGVSVAAEITIGRTVIGDAIMFTHNGIGGPAVYRATVRDLTSGMHINMAPGIDVFDILCNAKRNHGRRRVAGVLGAIMPETLARFFAPDGRNIADIRDTDLREIANKITNTFIPYEKIRLAKMSAAEITRGGVDVSEISQKTMESKLVPRMFFAGEVMDVAGDLGGFNLHWAWASGRIAGAAAAIAI